MLDWAYPLVLLGLAGVPVVRWLHHRAAAGTEIVVSSVLLWPEDSAGAGDRRKVPAPPDPAWRRRAAAFALLVIAAAGPRWSSNRRLPVEVWIDDAPSLLAREGDRNRFDLAVDRLRSGLKADRPASVLFRSLRDPGRTLSLDPGADGIWEGRLRAWLSPREAPLSLPPPAALRRDARHWLVTDGADQGLQGWLSAAPVDQLIRVGTATENAAVTALSLRRLAGRPDRFAAHLKVENLGDRPAERDLELRVGDIRLLGRRITLAPGESFQASADADLPRAGTLVRVRIEPGDDLASDDSISVDVDPLLPLAVRLDSACGPKLRAALRAHPGISVTKPEDTAAALAVSCGASPPAPAPPWLWFRPGGPREGALDPVLWASDAGTDSRPWLDPEWLRLGPETGADGLPVLTAGKDRTVISLAGAPDARRVDANLDSEWPALAGRPEYPALISYLLDEAAGKSLLDPSAAKSLLAAAHRIAPRTLSLPAAPRRGQAAGAARELSPYLVPLVALLLLWDLGRTRTAIGRVGCAAAGGLLLLAAWNPPLPWTGAATDVIVLWDDSESAGLAPSADRWKPVAAAVRDLPRGSRLALARFGAKPVLEAGLEAAGTPGFRELIDRGPGQTGEAVDPTSTDVEAALGLGLHLARPARPTTLLLAGDGRQTAGRAEGVLRSLKGAGIRVLGYPLRSPAWERDAWVADVSLPAHGRLDVPLTVRAVLRSAVARRADVELHLDGVLAQRAPVELVPGPGKLALLQAVPHRTGTVEVRVDLRLPGDPVPANNSRTQALRVLGPPRVLFVSAQGDASPVRGSLARGGWQVEAIGPAALQRALANPVGIPAVVLDDVAVPDAPTGAWEALADAVTHYGTGLVALGGPRSFAAGSYRGSRLERLLPVVSEPSRPAGGTAALFVVDTSGSMGRQAAGPAPLALVAEVMEAAAGTLPPGGQLGLVTFDVEAREVLPLAVQATPSQTLAPLVGRGPSGGTRAAPALALALKRLTASGAERRLLILLTDGHLGDPEGALAEAAGSIAGTGVDLVCVGAGDDVRLDLLALLVEGAGGSLLRAGRTAEVPDLLRRELARRTSPAARDGFRPRLLESLPFFPFREPWPALDGYCVTRPQPGARVYLESPLGDPLLAVGRAGTGQVVALPGGLGPWASRWVAWPRWGAFVGGLIDSVARREENPLLGARLVHTRGEVNVAVDALRADLGWSDGSSLEAVLIGASGQPAPLRLQPAAPGRFLGSVPVQRPGMHWLSVRGEQGSATAALWVDASEELLPPSVTGADFRRWEEQGLLQVWSPGDILEGPRRAAHPGQQSALMALAAGLFLALLAWERTPRSASWISRRAPTGSPAR